MTASFLLLMSIALPGVPAETVALFEAREHRCLQGRFAGRSFPYRLFVPRSMKARERYPLLVWMHGRGDAGTDNARHLEWADHLLDDPAHPSKYRFFVLALQCPWELQWFEQPGSASPGSEPPDDLLTVTHDIIRQTMCDCPVDPQRVYVVGISAGASASWEMAMRDPNLYAAVVPLACASECDESRAPMLKGIPIWAFINAGERGPVEKMVTAVRGAGGNAYLTVADKPGHDAWSAALDGGILQWILAQRRGGICWTPPGHEPWQSWHIMVLPAAFLIFVRVAWALEQRRRWWRVRIGRSKSTAPDLRGDQPERVAGWTSESVSQVVEQSVDEIPESVSHEIPADCEVQNQDAVL